MNYENLINRIKQNDNSAIMEFYNKFYKEVYYVCYKITENEKDAEDIAQETLIKAIDKIDTLKNPEGLSTWLKTIANNLSINYLKKNRKFNIVNNSEEMGEEIFEENRIAQKTPEDIVADKEVTDILTNMINRLPREQRITIFMFYYEELSVKEIAEIMDCSEATVRSRINYARKALRKQVDELENKGVKLRCIAILPFLFTVYSFEKTGVCAAIAMPSAGALSAGVKGGAANLAKAGKVAGEAAKMSLKAKIAIGAVAAVVLVGGTVGVVSLATSGNNDSNEVIDNSDLVVEEENGQELTDDTTDTSTDEQTDGMTHWIRVAKWNEEAEGFTENLFGISLPINLESLDEVCAPYTYFFNGFNGAWAQTMQAILNDPKTYEGEVNIYPDIDKPNNINNIYFVNYAEEELTIQQCYDKNWWYIDEIYNMEDVLGIDPEQLSSDYWEDHYEVPLLDIVAEKHGAPTYILMSDSFKDVIHNSEEEFWLWYELVYVHDEYVITLSIQDQPMKKYDTHNVVIHGVYYYTTECWNKKLEENPITGETTINGVTCKFRNTY